MLFWPVIALFLILAHSLSVCFHSAPLDLSSEVIISDWWSQRCIFLLQNCLGCLCRDQDRRQSWEWMGNGSDGGEGLVSDFCFFSSSLRAYLFNLKSTQMHRSSGHSKLVFIPVGFSGNVMEETICICEIHPLNPVMYPRWTNWSWSPVMLFYSKLARCLIRTWWSSGSARGVYRSILKPPELLTDMFDIYDLKSGFDYSQWEERLSVLPSIGKHSIPGG